MYIKVVSRKSEENEDDAQFCECKMLFLSTLTFDDEHISVVLKGAGWVCPEDVKEERIYICHVKYHS